jgi:hypothetical protein
MNKYDNLLNQGLGNRKSLKEYKNVQRRIQKMTSRKRNHSTVFTKGAAEKRNPRSVVVSMKSQIIQRGNI